MDQPRPCVVQLQAWNQRVKGFLPKDLKPIATHIQMRSEFSGACTAEQAVIAAGQLCRKDLTVECLSCADWSPAARQMAEMNHESTCRFKDIMAMAPPDLRDKLTEDVVEKAS